MVDERSAEERIKEAEAALDALRDEEVDAVVGSRQVLHVRLHEAEQKLHESAQFIRQVLDNLFTFVAVLEPDGTLIECNRAPLEAAGLRARDVLGRKYWDCYWWNFSPETQARLRDAIERAKQGDIVRYDTLIRVADDARMWIDFQIGPLRDKHGVITHLIPSGTDLTARRQVEQELRESEERFRTMADNISQFAWMADDKGSVFWYNRRWYEYTGTTFDAMKGMGWVNVLHPDHLDRIVARAQHSWDTGELFEETFPLRGKDGAYRWFLTHALPIRDTKGAVVRWFGTNTDITEQQEAEEALRRSREELEQRVEERTEELKLRADQLSRLSSELILTEHRERRRLATLLHDHMQQLLVAAKLGLHTLIHEPLKPKQRDIVKEANKLIDEVIRASRTLTVELTPPILHDGGLAAGFEWLARRMKDQHGLNIVLHGDSEFNIGREDCRVLIFQSVRELLFNVVKHAGVKKAHLSWEERDDGLLCVTVKDQGVGFDPDSVMASRGDDTEVGFGLVSIRERVSLLGGELSVESRRGDGAQFTLRVPVVREHTVPQAAAETTVRRKRRASRKRVAEANENKIRLLLVDDHKVLRQGLVAVFADEPDMEVIGEAADGEEALALARDLAPDVVLMDFSMPRMNGVDATRALQEQLPHIKIIGLSMYEDPERAAAMIRAGAIAYLSKTGDFSALLDTIRTAQIAR